MRRMNIVGAVLKSLAFVLVVGLTGYGARLALGEHEARNSSSYISEPSPSVVNEDGAEIYMTRCMSCHQMNGRGVPGVFPPLDGTDWVIGDKGHLIRVVLDGLTGEIKVGDETYSGAMPPWRSFLDDQQMADLLTYLRSTWSNDASEITPAEVASVRAVTEERRDPWTEAELQEAANTGIPGAENPDVVTEEPDVEAEKPDTSGQE